MTQSSHVLIVDDSASMRALLRHALTSSGFRVDQAEDGVAALEWLSSNTPDVIITDPPRAGMHPDVINVILNAAPKRIVYVSCNPATQARDLQLMDAEYKVAAVQPVDMFPHTPHVENVVLLEKR